MNSFTAPKILQCNLFVAHNASQDRRYVKDYEFDFYLGGERDITIDSNRYKISEGCMVFRKPGQLVSGIGNYNMYMLTLDFSHKSSIPPNRYIRGNNTPQQERCDMEILNDIPSVFIPSHQDDILSLYKALCACSYPNIIDETLQKKIVSEFLFLVLSDAYKHCREAAEQKPANKSYVEQACHYIIRNYSKDLSVSSIADSLSLNKNYLIKLFKKEISTTPNQYIKKTRLFYAKLMLIQTELPVGSIALDCGFNTTSYFIKCFKEAFGVSPLIYRNRYLTEKKM